MIRKASLLELDQIDELAVLAIHHMIDNNIPQWTLAYPRREHFEKDILLESLYVMEEKKEIIGVCCIRPQADPAYDTIHSWKKEHSLVIHRMLVHPEHQKQGIAKSFIEKAIELGKESGYESIKIDTHLKNYKMRNFLVKYGFEELEYLAVIDRLAYELVWEDL